MQKIKFILGFSDFGGSTLAIVSQAELLKKEFDVEMYGDAGYFHENYENVKFTSDLKIEPDDILIFHCIDKDERPNCKKCFLYVHEKSIFQLKSRQIKGYDNFIFVHENQKIYHGFDGHIIPNRIKHSLDLKKYHPPNNNIAGIVGTVQSRKNTHISISKALENNCRKVLLFGNKEDGYFERFVEPMLSDQVIYKGLFLDKMEMYNQFDDLYFFSNEECASLVIGECKVLGKRVFKSEHVDDFDVLDDDQILEKWKILFRS